MLRKEAMELCAIAKQNQHAAQFLLQTLRNTKVHLLAMLDMTPDISVQSLRRTSGETAPNLYVTAPSKSGETNSSARMAVIPADRNCKFCARKVFFFFCQSYVLCFKKWFLSFFFFLFKKETKLRQWVWQKTHTATNSTPSNLYAYHQGETQKRLQQLLTLFKHKWEPKPYKAHLSKIYQIWEQYTTKSGTSAIIWRKSSNASSYKWGFWCQFNSSGYSKKLAACSYYRWVSRRPTESVWNYWPGPDREIILTPPTFVLLGSLRERFKLNMSKPQAKKIMILALGHSAPQTAQVCPPQLQGLQNNLENIPPEKIILIWSFHCANTVIENKEEHLYISCFIFNSKNIFSCYQKCVSFNEKFSTSINAVMTLFLTIKAYKSRFYNILHWFVYVVSIGSKHQTMHSCQLLDAWLFGYQTMEL